MGVTPLRRLSAVAPALAVAGLLAGCASSGADSEADVLAAMESFYEAIEGGDAEGAMRLIAPDAVFVESGMVETRDQYEQNHLPRDIDFERQFTGEREREVMRVGVEGNLAWILARTRYDGTFDDFPLEFDSFQLVVLSRASGQWLIESVHWSSI